VRLTTRYSQRDFRDAFFSAMHEMGHGLYEQGLDADHYGTPSGEAPSMAVHESQSRLWERFIGMSAPFWHYFFPKAHEMFHQSLYDVNTHDFYRSVNHVQASWNRVRADDVTYDLHILARFELEQALIDGDLSPRDVPGAWNEKYHDLLAVHPANDAEGCLQDSHWAAGQFGYFPAYTLGNVLAAQLWQQAQLDLPDLHRQFATGHFGDFLSWLQRHIFQHGGCYSSVELLRQITGTPPDQHALVKHLETKHAEIYGL
jgi:carboxypeptidase Taq